MASIVERCPHLAVRNACTRMRMIIDGTLGVAEDAHARALIEAIGEQVGEELDIIERALVAAETQGCGR